MMNNEIERLALAVHALRPEWPEKSLRTFIARNMNHRAYSVAAIALVWVALDPKTDNPGRVLGSGPWWKAASGGGVEIAPTLPRVRSADICQGCTRDRSGHDAINRHDPESAHEWLSLAQYETQTRSLEGVL